MNQVLSKVSQDKMDKSNGIRNTRFHPPSAASLIAQLGKNLPAMQETLVNFLGWDYLLGRDKTTHSSILGLPL